VEVLAGHFIGGGETVTSSGRPCSWNVNNNNSNTPLRLMLPSLKVKGPPWVCHLTPRKARSFLDLVVFHTFNSQASGSLHGNTDTVTLLGAPLSSGQALDDTLSCLFEDLKLVSAHQHQHLLHRTKMRWHK